MRAPSDERRASNRPVSLAQTGKERRFRSGRGRRPSAQQAQAQPQQPCSVPCSVSARARSRSQRSGTCACSPPARWWTEDAPGHKDRGRRSAIAKTTLQARIPPLRGLSITKVGGRAQLRFAHKGWSGAKRHKGGGGELRATPSQIEGRGACQRGRRMPARALGHKGRGRAQLRFAHKGWSGVKRHKGSGGELQATPSQEDGGWQRWCVLLLAAIFKISLIVQRTTHHTRLSPRSGPDGSAPFSKVACAR